MPAPRRTGVRSPGGRRAAARTRPGRRESHPRRRRRRAAAEARIGRHDSRSNKSFGSRSRPTTSRWRATSRPATAPQPPGRSTCAGCPARRPCEVGTRFRGPMGLSPFFDLNHTGPAGPDGADTAQTRVYAQGGTVRIERKVRTGETHTTITLPTGPDLLPARPHGTARRAGAAARVRPSQLALAGAARRRVLGGDKLRRAAPQPPRPCRPSPGADVPRVRRAGRRRVPRRPAGRLAALPGRRRGRREHRGQGARRWSTASTPTISAIASWRRPSSSCSAAPRCWRWRKSTARRSAPNRTRGSTRSCRATASSTRPRSRRCSTTPSSCSAASPTATSTPSAPPPRKRWHASSAEDDLGLDPSAKPPTACGAAEKVREKLPND